MTEAAATERAGAAAAGFRPPVYPYERLEPLRAVASQLEGGLVDLSVGTPADPPPAALLAALAGAAGAGEPGFADDDGAVRGYPASVGGTGVLDAICAWFARRFAVTVGREHVAVCVGTKEFVATLPGWLALRRPGADTVLYPAVSYPTYAMGATLAGLRAVPVPVDERFRLRLDAVAAEDAARALLLWVNSPGNPAGQLDDLAAAAAWGRQRGILVASDECYAEYTWDGPPRTVLDVPAGPGRPAFEGVLAVHSLSKRSNAAGLRLGWYAGDPEVVGYLREVRKHAGFMVPGPIQRAGVAALADQEHVHVQRDRYRRRLERAREIFAALGLSAPAPQGGFYLWVPAPDGDAWGLAERLAREGGALVSPGEFYWPAGAGHVRVALVRPLEQLDLVARRMGVEDRIASPHG